MSKNSKSVRRSSIPATRRPVEYGQLERLVRESGHRATVQAGYMRIEGTTGRRIYVPLRQAVTRVDLSGDFGGRIGVPHRTAPTGRVTHELDFTQTPKAVLAAFARALAAL